MLTPSVVQGGPCRQQRILATTWSGFFSGGPPQRCTGPIITEDKLMNLNKSHKMNGFSISRLKGMTMMELMIVLIVVAILVALAYPSYTNYVRKARRGEAQQLLLNWSVNQEIFRSNNAAYAPDTSGVLPKPTHANYAFTAATSATTYTLTATASGDQLNDKLKDGVTVCSPLTITNVGAKGPTGCWQ